MVIRVRRSDSSSKNQLGAAGARRCPAASPLGGYSVPSGASAAGLACPALGRRAPGVMTPPKSFIGCLLVPSMRLPPPGVWEDEPSVLHPGVCCS